MSSEGPGDCGSTDVLSGVWLQTSLEFRQMAEAFRAIHITKEKQAKNKRASYATADYKSC